MNNTDLTDCIIAQGRALMHAIETVGDTIEPSGSFPGARAAYSAPTVPCRLGRGSP